MAAERVYYLSWIDKRTDPWPQWEEIRPGTTAASLSPNLSFVPADDPEWPEVPFAGGPSKVSDARMGQYAWPGIPWKDNGRLYVGPTLSALFHPASRFFALRGLERAYLLYQQDSSGSSHEVFGNVLEKICRARKARELLDRIKLVPIAGITDPTDHRQVIEAIKQWVGRSDPFNYGVRGAGKVTTRIIINLSPGTPSMHASWLILRWNGALGKGQTIVEFVQGDGGLSEELRDPLRVVPVDMLAQWINLPASAPPTPDGSDAGILIETLQGAPYDLLRQKIDHAAVLGLPILLQGERGTGKTWLARYYHQRRRFYREQRGEHLRLKKARPRESSGQASAERYPENASADPFVTVTLSEFGDLETLRDTLFGWAKGSWNLAHQAYDGLLGEAHNGTLFLDEIHHLDRGLQAALLGPLNSRRYRPKMATYEVTSNFNLVVATNDPQWRTKLADDFRDRVERIVLEVPAFRSFQRTGAEILWKFWEYTLQRRCVECGILDDAEGSQRSECRELLLGLLRRHPLTGNWRDLQRLADNVLLHLTSARDGRPSPLQWNRDQLERAIDETFSEK
jgi:hypothetical protein